MLGADRMKTSAYLAALVASMLLSGCVLTRAPDVSSSSKKSISLAPHNMLFIMSRAEDIRASRLFMRPRCRAIADNDCGKIVSGAVMALTDWMLPLLSTGESPPARGAAPTKWDDDLKKFFQEKIGIKWHIAARNNDEWKMLEEDFVNYIGLKN